MHLVNTVARRRGEIVEERVDVIAVIYTPHELGTHKQRVPGAVPGRLAIVKGSARKLSHRCSMEREPLDQLSQWCRINLCVLH